jgi:acyl-CoA thioester hydrolase
MARIYQWEFVIRSYELNQNGIIDPAVYQNFLEETAIQASAANGFGLDWYDRNGYSWIIRRMQVRYTTPIRYGERLLARSWVSDFRRVRSNREYELLRASNNERVLRARADWVFVDTETHQITRILPEFEPAFDPDPGTAEDLGLHLDTPPVSNPRQFVIERPVYYYELDELRHVNNANYLRWIDDAFRRALDSVSIPHTAVRPLGHDIEYKHEARFGDVIRIESHLHNLTETCWAWQNHLVHAKTYETIALDYALYQVLEPLPDEALNLLCQA